MLSKTMWKQAVLVLVAPLFLGGLLCSGGDYLISLDDNNAPPCCALAVNGEVAMYTAFSSDVIEYAEAENLRFVPEGVAQVISQEGARFRIRGLAEGHTKLVAKFEHGQASIDLAVKPHVATEIVPAHEPLPEAFWRKEESIGVVEAGELSLAAHHLDREGNPLMGVLETEWSLEGNTSLVLQASTGDVGALIRASRVIESGVVHANDGSLSFDVISASQITRLTLLPIAEARVDGNVDTMIEEGESLPPGTYQSFHLAAFTGDGRYVAGNSPDMRVTSEFGTRVELNSRRRLTIRSTDELNGTFEVTFAGKQATFRLPSD